MPPFDARRASRLRRPAPIAQNVDDRGQSGVERRDREERDLDGLSLAFGALHRKLEVVDGVLRRLSSLVRHGTVPVAVHVAVRVPSGHDVVALLAEDRPRRPAEHLLAPLVPKDDPVGRVDREDGLAAPSDTIEGLVGLGHGGTCC